MLADYKTPLMGDFLSLESTISVDCAIGKQFDIYYKYYTKSMGSGYTVEYPSPVGTSWVSPAPNSVMSVVMKTICSKYY